MILDDIIAALVALFQTLIEGAILVIESLVNLIAWGIEGLVSLFISDFHMGRMRRKRERPRGSAIAGFSILAVILVLVCWLFVLPKVMNQTVTFVAKDGQSLTYAGVIIHTNKEDRHRRTNRSGEIRIPRFATKAITIKDARYVEQRWEKSEIEDTLTVRRSVLGSSLDILSERLRRPAEE